MRMRPVMIMAVAALAVSSACGSSGGHATSSAAAARTKPHGPASAGVPAVKADVPGFSGPMDASRGGHVFGRCLHSWYTRTNSGTRVHVGYPGPATISVDLSIDDQSEPPPEAHQQFVMAGGRQTNELRFPAIPHAGYPQITVTSGQRTLICDAPEH
jgi:hypothetical protein